jgi:hypothetical protein
MNVPGSVHVCLDEKVSCYAEGEMEMDGRIKVHLLTETFLHLLVRNMTPGNR